MWRSIVGIIVILAVSFPVCAKPGKTKKAKVNRTVQEQTIEEQTPDFSPAERNFIRAQLQGQKRLKQKNGPEDLPRGLQKKTARGKSLPPGWQKKIAIGKSLDYHVYRMGNSLPEEILRQLPPPPIGSEIVQVEEKIIRLNSATRTILDIFDLSPTH